MLALSRLGYSAGMEKNAVSPPPQTLQAELRWLLQARFVVAFLLATAAIAGKLCGNLQSVWPALVVSLGIALYNSVLILTKLLDRRPGAATVASLHLDVLALTGYLHFTGDLENPLQFAYVLPVAAGAILISRRAGLLLGASASLLFLLLIFLTMSDTAPVPLSHHHLALVRGLNLHDRVDPDLNEQGWTYILTHVIVLAAVLLGAAHGCGTLARRFHPPLAGTQAAA